MAVNKIDTPKVETLVADFYQLGVEQMYPISAEHGLGVAELLDAMYALLPSSEEASAPVAMPRIAIVGRPNVGKSTLLNAVLGEERAVVSDVPGTTRDAIDSLVTYEDRRYRLTDTAGIRRRGKIDRGSKATVWRVRCGQSGDRMWPCSCSTRRKGLPSRTPRSPAL